MYFNNLVETISTIPNYFLTDILNLKHNIKLAPDERHIIGEGNKIQRFLNADLYVRSYISDITAFVVSQQLPFLKNMVSYESGIVAQNSNVAEIKMPTRYIARAGEQVIIPLSGTATVTSTEFNDTFTLSTGFVYRLNNRINSTFTTSDDFLAVFVSLVDFDMKKYLLAHDWHSPYTRKKDEYANSTLAPEVVEETPSY
jgi:hypothetical protein